MPQDTETRSKRRVSKYWIYGAIIVWALSFMIVCGFGVFVIIRGQQINSALCRVTDDNRTTLINVLGKVEEQSLARAANAFERNLIRQSFNELVAVIPPLSCSIKGGLKELKP